MAALFPFPSSKARVRAMSSANWPEVPGGKGFPSMVSKLETTKYPHLGEKALQRLLERSFRGTGLQTTIRQVVYSCPTCQSNKCPRSSKTPAGPTRTTVWDLPRRGLAMDFTQMPVSQGYKYLLVMIHSQDGLKAFPPRLRRLKRWLKKKLLPEIILRFGLLWSLQSDNGTSFNSKVT